MAEDKLKGFWRDIVSSRELEHGNVRCRLKCGHEQTVRLGMPTNVENSDPFNSSWRALFCTECLSRQPYSRDGEDRESWQDGGG